MKKLITLICILSFALPSQAFFWNKKDKALEKELQGKGYAGTLPDIGDRLEPTKTKVSKPIFEPQDGFDDKDKTGQKMFFRDMQGNFIRYKQFS